MVLEKKIQNVFTYFYLFIYQGSPIFGRVTVMAHAINYRRAILNSPYPDEK